MVATGIESAVGLAAGQALRGRWWVGRLRHNLGGIDMRFPTTIAPLFITAVSGVGDLRTWVRYTLIQRYAATGSVIQEKVL
jgi:hypothetical protein